MEAVEEVPQEVILVEEVVAHLHRVVAAEVNILADPKALHRNRAIKLLPEDLPVNMIREEAALVRVEEEVGLEDQSHTPEVVAAGAADTISSQALEVVGVSMAEAVGAAPTGVDQADFSPGEEAVSPHPHLTVDLLTRVNANILEPSS